jgi:hypothetical protein
MLLPHEKPMRDQPTFDQKKSRCRPLRAFFVSAEDFVIERAPHLHAHHACRERSRRLMSLLLSRATDRTGRRPQGWLRGSSSKSFNESVKTAQAGVPIATAMMCRRTLECICLPSVPLVLASPTDEGAEHEDQLAALTARARHSSGRVRLRLQQRGRGERIAVTWGPVSASAQK